MKKKRRLPSYLRSMGFILMIFSAIALPSAGEDSRVIVFAAALLGLALVAAGIFLGIYYYKKKPPADRERG